MAAAIALSSRRSPGWSRVRHAAERHGGDREPCQDQARDHGQGLRPVALGFHQPREEKQHQQHGARVADVKHAIKDPHQTAEEEHSGGQRRPTAVPVQVGPRGDQRGRVLAGRQIVVLLVEGVPRRVEGLAGPQCPGDQGGKRPGDELHGGGVRDLHRGALGDDGGAVYLLDALRQVGERRAEGCEGGCGDLPGNGRRLRRRLRCGEGYGAAAGCGAVGAGERDDQQQERGGADEQDDAGTLLRGGGVGDGDGEDRDGEELLLRGYGAVGDLGGEQDERGGARAGLMPPGTPSPRTGRWRRGMPARRS